MWVRLRQDLIHVGRRFAVSFQRTLKVPDDGREYPLPAGLGRFPVLPTRSVPPRQRPTAWREKHSYFLPMYSNEAMWLAFQGQSWHPVAVQVFVDGVNALSVGAANEPLSATPQNYLVSPEQPWLDGVVSGKGKVRQFVATAPGTGDSVAAQVRGRESSDGLLLRVFDAVPGRFPDRPPAPADMPRTPGRVMQSLNPMAMGVGGTVRQKVYPDPFGLSSWDQRNVTDVRVYLCDASQYHAVTGRPAPPTPITPKTYAAARIPWFELDDSNAGAIAGTARTRGLRSVGSGRAKKHRRHR